MIKSIIQGAERQVGALFPQQSGSLGRLIALDPQLNWLVSTTMCLFQPHSDDHCSNTNVLYLHHVIT